MGTATIRWFLRGSHRAKPLVAARVTRSYIQKHCLSIVSQLVYIQLTLDYFRRVGIPDYFVYQPYVRKVVQSKSLFRRDMPHFSTKNKNPFSLFERMDSPVDNLGKYIPFSSEGLSASLLVSWVVRLLGHPLIDNIT